MTRYTDDPMTRLRMGAATRPTTNQWIIPPETLLCNALALPCSPPHGPGKYYVLVFTPKPQGWSLNSNAPYVRINSEPPGPGYLAWAVEVKTNSGIQRQDALRLRHGGDTTHLELVQVSGRWIEELAGMVLNPPAGTERANFPLAMELGAAGKFIAQLLKKIPLPYRLIAYGAVVAAVGALGATTIAVRAAFTTVPEPPNYFSLPLPPKCSPIEPLMTVELITQQTGLLIAYISQQML